MTDKRTRLNNREKEMKNVIIDGEVFKRFRHTSNGVSKSGKCVTLFWSGYPNYQGYMIAGGSAGRKKTFRVHRMVAECGLGPEPVGKPYVHHKDHNRQNNAASNLEYISAIENCQLQRGKNKITDDGG